MEKVKVIKGIPGILEVGDILVATGFGEDFILETSDRQENRATERYVNLDYYSVVENIPEFFVFAYTFDDMPDDIEPDMNFAVERSNEDIFKRYEYFVDQVNSANPGTEQDVVYHNLIWFIQWLTGQTSLIK